MGFLEILKSIKNFFTKDNIIWTLLIVSIIFILLNVHSCNEIEKTKQEARQNIEAAKGELKKEKDKNGELVSYVAVYTSSLKDLETKNKELYDLVQSQNGKIISANITLGKIKVILGFIERGQQVPESKTFSLENLKKGIKDVLDFSIQDTISKDYKQSIVGNVIYGAKLEENNFLKVSNLGLNLTENSTTLSLKGTIRRNDKGIVETSLSNSRLNVIDMKGVIIDENSLIREKEVGNRSVSLGLSLGAGSTASSMPTFNPFDLNSWRYYIGIALNINLYTLFTF